MTSHHEENQPDSRGTPRMPGGNPGRPEDSGEPVFAQLLAVNVGNTRTGFGLFRGHDLVHAAAIVNPPIARGETSSDASADASMSQDVVAAIREALAAKDFKNATAVVASVRHELAARIEAGIRPHVQEVLRLNRDVPIRITHSLDDDSTVGQDRLLNAIAAHAMFDSACVIISAGTAITVDFVDGAGVFHGGAIAPGLRMMLRAMHEQTSALPMVELAVPRAEREAGTELADVRGPFGKDTTQAMLVGVLAAARGLAHNLIDSYAQFFGAYPRVVATGGDALMLFENDALVERIEPDLTLRGILEACQRADEDED
ncbi:MAG: type III pantothenate kinase [Planctomycetota bacterium]|nr:type III pantothenate kinase [Planctomycetota bacterium]